MRFSLTLVATLALGAKVFARPVEVKCNDGSCHKPVEPELPEGVLDQVEMIYSSEGQYLLPLSIGTPPQSGFNVVFDTGSDASWLPTSAACPSCSSTYDPSASTTAVKQGEKKERIDYDDGKCAIVELYQDTVTWGSSWKADYKNLTIGAATELEGFDSSSVGYFGFGNSEMLQLFTNTNEEIYENGGTKKLKKRDDGTGEVSITNPGAASPPEGGDRKRQVDNTGRFMLTLGVDKTAYTGEIYYFNLPASESDCENQSIFWRTALKGVGLKNTYDCNLLPKSYAKFATGTHAIKAPPVQADILHLKFGAIYNTFNHRYEFNCYKPVPDLEFQFENYQINIPASLWTTRVDPDDQSDDAKCYSQIRRGSDRFKEWTIGTRVLNEFYQVYSYDMLRVGLAHRADGSGVATITNLP